MKGSAWMSRIIYVPIFGTSCHYMAYITIWCPIGQGARDSAGVSLRMQRVHCGEHAVLRCYGLPVAAGSDRSFEESPLADEKARSAASAIRRRVRLQGASQIQKGLHNRHSHHTVFGGVPAEAWEHVLLFEQRWPERRGRLSFTRLGAPQPVRRQERPADECSTATEGRERT